MNLSARALAVLLAATATGVVAAPPAKAPAAPKAAAAAPAIGSLTTERQKVSYMIGLDIAQSIAPAAPDLDIAELQRAIANGVSGGKPLLAEDQARKVAEALTQRINARRSPTPGAAALPAVSKQQVADLVGADIGRSLSPIKDEFDLPVLVQALRTSLAGGKVLMEDAERNALRESFSTSLRTKMEARAAAAAKTNREEGAKFLAENKLKKGVFTTPSGLQYMVLRQGSGTTPRASDRVRVNYHGTLLDGTVFDSSYERGGNGVEFPLNQVIPGWTEGVSMMPVGAKYRFWIPSDLGYGEKGAPGIGPNATLVFDVELLAVLP